jgi:hypothetical protein
MSLAQQFDIGRYIHGTAALASATVPSSSGGATSTGITIDRQAFGRQYYSAAALIHASFAGSTQQVATVSVSFQHSSDGTSWDNFSTGSNVSKTIGSTGATGAQTLDDVVNAPVRLLSARRYIRVQTVPTFSLTTSGDSVVLSGVLALGGADELPATS